MDIPSSERPVPGVPCAAAARLRSPVHIRRSRITDLPALRALARFEERELPRGTFLVAEVRGSIVAAAPVQGRAPGLANGRRCSDDLRCLLERQVRFVGS